MGGDLVVEGGAWGTDAELTDISTHARVVSDAGGVLLGQAGPIAAAATSPDVLGAGVICPDVLPGPWPRSRRPSSVLTVSRRPARGSSPSVS